MPVKSLASLVTAVVVAEVAGSAEVLALSAALSADTLSDTLSDVLADTLSDVLTDTLADALDASKTCEEAATLDASVELQAVKLSAALTIAAAMVNFFFIVISPFCFHVLPAVVQAIFFAERDSHLYLSRSLSFYCKTRYVGCAGSCLARFGGQRHCRHITPIFHTKKERRRAWRRVLPSGSV